MKKTGREYKTMVTLENMILILIIGTAAYLYFSRQTTKQTTRKKKQTLVKGMRASSSSNAASTSQQRPLHQLVGKPAADLMGQLGQPKRVDLSMYGHEWWIYQNQQTSYIQVGVYKDQIQSIYTMNNSKSGFGPTYHQLHSRYNFNRELQVNNSRFSCEFHLSEEDLLVRPLIQFHGHWAVLSFDKHTKELCGIWYLTTYTLLLYRPYSMSYSGHLQTLPPISQAVKKKVEQGMAMQIFETTNVIRVRHQLPAFQWDDKSAEVALNHSKDMCDNNYFSHTSPTRGELSDRFQQHNIPYQMLGENIAAKQVTSFAAVEGWLNSPGHRVNLLNRDFTHLGVGVCEDVYTQNFLTKRKQPI